MIFVAGAVELVDVFRFTVESGNFGCAELHSGSELIGGDACLQLGVFRKTLGVSLVELFEKSAGGTFLIGGHAFWQSEVTDRRLRIHRNALVLGRQKSRTPVGFAVGRFAAHVGERYVGWQVFVETAESVADPRPGRRVAFLGETGVHVNAARSVGVGLGVHAVQEGHVVDVLRHVRQQTGNAFAALAGGRQKIPRRAHQVAVRALKREKFLFTGQRLAVVFFQRGFVFPEVDMRGGAGTERPRKNSRVRASSTTG